MRGDVFVQVPSASLSAGVPAQRFLQELCEGTERATKNLTPLLGKIIK